MIQMWSSAALCTILCLLILVRTTHAKGGLCEVETGLSNIILDIEESRGKEITQPTMPEELPIVGDPFTEIALDVIFTGRKPVFILNGKKPQLLEPLDRDADNLSHIVFQLTCTVKSTGKKRTIPVIVRVSDVNDNAPMFLNTPYETSVAELTPVGTTIFQGIKAVDHDAGVNGLVEYQVVPGTGAGTITGIGKNRITVADGFGLFAINLPHQGQVTVNRSLDYEKTQRYLLTVVASDRARNNTERFSSTTTLTVNIKDDDDQDPSFIYQGCMLLDGACINPEYHSLVSSGVLTGVLNISPEKIQAVDMDSINAAIEYSFLSGSPSNFQDCFMIDTLSGAVRQIKPVDSSQTKHFEIIVKAEEVSESRRFTTAKLNIAVKPVDVHPPEINTSALLGSVSENAPIGTRVIDSNGKAIRLTVSDADLTPLDPKPSYTFELTTDMFAVDASGLLVVAAEGLDRDPPSPGEYRFQVVAREVGGHSAASAPLALTVALLDINDNAPVLPSIPPVSVEAGDGKRDVYKVEATDNDLEENALLTYSIYHISNNGRGKFKIDPRSGLITTSGKLNAGDQYSITVQATDTGGKSSQAIVEVTVTPGPNTKSPVFTQPLYDIQVSEGAAINATVATVQAIDPEHDPVIYSILTGNDLRQFAVSYNTGVISVIRKLDREDLTRYQLLVKAEDSGGLSSTATVNIKVTDINDKNPEFRDLPYLWTVAEGPAGRRVGRVRAQDADEGINALVKYSLPEGVPFSIDAATGDVTTTTALDYETQKVHTFVVTAQDGAPEPRLATATVTVSLQDIEDEIPIFHILEYKSRIPENVPDYMIIQVKADDPDTVKKITYILKQGPTDLFAVDPQSGVVRCTRGLDFEREREYTLLIGTLENQTGAPGSVTKVVVEVEDRNDIPPTFSTVPRPVTLEDEVPIGTTVATLTATDSDGTAPNNKVRYELIGRRKAMKYFQVDPDTGILRVRDDLRKETDTEYQVDVKAYDLGEPSLSSVTTVPVYVRHTATVAPEAGLGFADDEYSVDIPEDAKANQLVKTISVLNSRVHNVPLKCEIVSGNNDSLFSINATAERNCEIRLRQPKLDHETTQMYNLGVRLDTLSGLVNPQSSTTSVRITVTDVNDNSPVFIYPLIHTAVVPAYFAAVSRETQLGTHLVTVKAVDEDSGKFGNIVYELLPGPGADLVTVDNSTGIVQTKKTLDGLTSDELPVVLRIQARDNPASAKGNKNETQIFVNIIEEQNRMVLVIEDARRDILQESKDRLIELVEEHTGLVVGIEKFSARQFISENKTTEWDPMGTDVWFYTIDPETKKILERNSSRVQRAVFEPLAMSNITFDISGNIGVTATKVRAPLIDTVPRTTIAAASIDVFPYTIIIIAVLILVLGIVGIVYICVSWSRYKAYKDQTQSLYSTPRYDPVFVEPNNLKEYETQVLQMSVPLDDDASYNDLQLDFSAKNHAFSLENVSYITKDHNSGGPSPVSSETATTARASSLTGTGNRHNLLNNENSIYQNSFFSRSPDESVGHNLNISPSNDNVTFREKDYNYLGYSDRSPVETTTEL